MKLHKKLDQVQQHLSTVEEQSIDHIEFNWEGIDFIATAEPAPGDTVDLHLSAKLGRLFYTIEDDLQRNMAMERLFQSNLTLDGRYSIGSKGDISFNSKTRFSAPLDTKAFMSGLAITLLEAERHLRGLQAHLKQR